MWLLEFVVPVELVQEAVQDRREYQRGRDDKDETGIERIDSGKQLSAVRLWRVDWPHSTQEHRGVEKGISPRKTFKEYIAPYADCE